jgi:hypothetical protein
MEWGAKYTVTLVSIGFDQSTLEHLAFQTSIKKFRAAVGGIKMIITYDTK